MLSINRQTTTPSILQATAARRPAKAAAPLAARRLTNRDTAEVLTFLAKRPLQTVIMAGLIRSYGLDSPLNRGMFYACRDERGTLEGVALIGHATLLATTTDRALRAFARLAQTGDGRTHMIMGEEECIRSFWWHYSTSDERQQMRLACRELLFELTHVSTAQRLVSGLRPAVPDDLELILPVQAELAFLESGVNPREIDPVGFRQRTLRRVEKGQTWVLFKDGQLIFKAEVQSETPQVIYLEGIYVRPEARGQGYGRRCLSQLCNTLLKRADSICLLVNEEHTRAHNFYQQLGFRLRSRYDTIFLRQRHC